MGPAQAQQDYDPASPEWNGLSELVELAREADIAIETPAQLDVSDLSPNDALIIVYPTRELPVADLSAFMRAGGRVAVADDFGAGTALLSAYGIARSTPPRTGAPQLRGNRALPVARSHGIRHPLAQGVRALVGNHPAVVAHPELEPLFAFGNAREALVLAGAVEAGRLIVVSDPSVFINNMLQFGGNRRFATNLLRYMDDERGGRIVLVTRDVPLGGHWDSAGGGPAERVRSWLGDVAAARTPPLALQLGSVLLLALFVLVTVSSLPRRSPYEGTSMLPRAAPAGGFVGRVAFFRQRPNNLIYPLMVYKVELERELVRRLGLQGQPMLREVVDAARRHGVPEAEVESMRRLLLELDDLRQRQDRPPSPPRIGQARFRQIVRTGERILERVRAERGRAAEPTAATRRTAGRQDER